ncbi:DUF6463 family protein [Paeniglutamicibacter sp. MACA_103]|uniref:DUF6463 family protein n=1 Tax=Paeniglutamicibacter sp. MACA_103 TaxID=3377337 RepID=UPI0038938C60
MSTRQRLMLRWSGGIMIGLGIGHLLLATFLDRHVVASWLDRGIWAAVPLMSPETTLGSLRNGAAFWETVGSFAVPLALLGGLLWHLAGRGVTVPAFIGWGVAAWSLLGGILLVPSPYFAGVVAGALIVLSARKNRGARGTGHLPEEYGRADHPHTNQSNRQHGREP